MSTTIEITWSDLTDITDSISLDGDQIRTDYSGRGMNGATCLGITGSVRDLAMFAVALTERETEAADQDEDLPWISAGRIIDRVESDGYGHETIFYFPGVVVTGAPVVSVTQDDD